MKAYSKSIKPFWKFTNKYINGYRVIENTVNKRQGFFIDHGPIIGIEHFGIIDYGTNVIVIRPNTSCFLDCIYCYVDESNPNKKDFLVDQDLILKGFKYAKEFKKHNVEAHLDAEGDVFLYPWLYELIEKLRPLSKTISIDTHGYLLTKEVVDKLANAGIDRINIVFNTLKQEKIKTIYGINFNIEKYKEVVAYASKKFAVTLTPILVPTYNYNELKDIILWAKKHIKRWQYPIVAPMNYLVYPHGKRPVRPMPFPGFIEFLKKMEKETNEQLWLNFEESFGIKKDTSIPIKFKKGEIINAKVILPGRWRNEYIGEAKDRLILIKANKLEIGEKVNIKITHNFRTYKAEVY